MEAKPLNLVRPDVPWELAAVAGKMMAKVPARRYQTPAEVARALKPFFKAVEAGPVERTPQISEARAPAAGERAAPPRSEPAPPRATLVRATPEPAAGKPLESTQADLIGLEPLEIAVGEPSSSDATALHPTRVQSRPAWLPAAVATGVLLLGLLSVWAAGVLKVKTKDGVIVLVEPLATSPRERDRQTEPNTPSQAPVSTALEPLIKVKRNGSPAVGSTSPVPRAHILPPRPVQNPVGSRQTSFLGDEPPLPSAAHDPSALELDRGRPMLVAPYCAASPVADGIVEECEYGKAQYVDFTFTANSRFGALQSGMGDPSQSKAPDDLSVRLRTAYSDKSLFLAAQVRDQFVDDQDADRDRPQLNDGVEIFLDGDRVSNDYLINSRSIIASSEGFQLLADSAGHQCTTARDFTNKDWKTAAKRYNEGYVIEVEVPLALIDVMDGRGKVAAGPGSAINLGLAINDNDAAVHQQMSYAFIRARPSVPSPFIGREDSWTFGIKLAPGPSAADLNPRPERAWQPLFNGRDLTGWKTHRSQPGNWRVKNGILIGSGRAASYLYTDRGDFQDLHLRVEAQINDAGNSGVYLRAPFGPKLPSNKPVFPIGYEGQINSTHRDPNRIGSLYVGAEGAVVSVLETLVRPFEWCTLEMIAQDNRIIVKVNGRTTADYTDRKHRFASGHIALQQHDPQTVVEFRKIEIKELR